MTIFSLWMDRTHLRKLSTNFSKLLNPISTTQIMVQLQFTAKQVWEEPGLSLDFGQWSISRFQQSRSLDGLELLDQDQFWDHSSFIFPKWNPTTSSRNCLPRRVSISQNSWTSPLRTSIKLYTASLTKPATWLAPRNEILPQREGGHFSTTEQIIQKPILRAKWFSSKFRRARSKARCTKTRAQFRGKRFLTWRPAFRVTKTRGSRLLTRQSKQPLLTTTEYDESHRNQMKYSPA